jgi:hypothetical protein
MPHHAAVLTLLLAALPAAAEKLTFDVTLFGIEVGEIEVRLLGDRIEMAGETAGALLLFFPAKESVTVRLKGGRPTKVVRRYEHPGKSGEWTATFAGAEVRIRHRRGDKVLRRSLRVLGPVYDPISALQKLRRSAPAAKFEALVFGVDGVYRFRARRTERRPLQYRGRIQRVAGYGRRPRKPPRMPLWLRALGLGRGATAKPEFRVWLDDGPGRLPLKVRLSDPRGALELVLRRGPLSGGARRRRAPFAKRGKALGIAAAHDCCAGAANRWGKNSQALTGGMP